MKSPFLIVLAAGASLVVPVSAGPTPRPGHGPSRRPDASPIHGVRIPQGYRDWTLVAPAQEAAPLDELRAGSAAARR